MVRGGPVGVAVKRRLRERGFEAGQALGERLFGSVCSPWSVAAVCPLSAPDPSHAYL